MTALSEFEDSQAAFYLLRVSYSIVRAVHFMRTTPLEHWRDHAKSFDKLMRKAVETILGTPLPEHSYKQSCLTPKLGGMGGKSKRTLTWLSCELARGSLDVEGRRVDSSSWSASRVHASSSGFFQDR